MPEPVALLTPTMTDAELKEQQAALSEAILALGGGGSQVEQPLCTLNRYIMQEAARLPQHAVFLVISDEDDTSSGRNCLAGHTTQVTAVGDLRECTEDCDEYRYSMTGPVCSRVIDFNCVPVDDLGTLYPDQAKHQNLYQQICDSTPESACTPEQLTLTKQYCAPGSVPRDCVVHPSQTSMASCFVTRPDTSTDLCKSAFTYGGNYTNLANYCATIYGGGSWTDCQAKGYKRVPRPGAASMSFVPEPVVYASSTADLIKDFHTRASAAFPDGGYKVQAIVLDPAFSCPIKTGQSYATNLRSIANTPDDVFPICEPYTKALSVIKGFAASLLVDEYQVQLANDEVIESVQVTDRRGASRKLDSTGFTFDRSTSALSFNPNVLTSNDVDLSVEIVTNCRPKIL